MTLAFSRKFEGNDRSFNNADSFAMAFDDAWRKLDLEQKNPKDKLQVVLSELKDHPFLQDNPVKANEIGEFRIRLLGL